MPHSPIHTLKAHFPQCFDKNGDLMPHKLQEAILDLAQESTTQQNTPKQKDKIQSDIATDFQEKDAILSLSKETYTLNWLGKSYAKLLRHLPTNTLIAQDLAHNTQAEHKNSKNVLIKGDNLEVLKHLKNAYYNKIKMIYIDPPYNTGNDGFIYNDERNFTPQSLSQMANIELDEANKILNYTLKNSSTHSAWLSFMYPRLYIARGLLRDDGVIFISIDDNEQANLKILCDEIFGEDNFICNFIWHSKNKPSGNTTENKSIDTRTEYILCYQKSNNFSPNKDENTKDELLEKGYTLKDEYFDERGYYKLTPLMHSCSASSFKYLESLDYEIQAPDGTMFKNHQNLKKPKSYRYTWSKKLFDFGNANGFIKISKTGDGHWCAYRKMYEFCAIDNKKLEIMWRKSGNAYHNLISNIYSDMGANEVRNIMNGEKIFTYAKPTNLIKQLLKIATTPHTAQNGGGGGRLTQHKLCA